MDLIECRRCRTMLPSDAFTPSQAKRSDAWCRPCFNAYRRAVRAGEVAVNRRSGVDCPGCGADLSGQPSNRKWCSERCRAAHFARTNPEYWTRRHYRSEYGMEVADKAAMLASQGDRCAICGTAEARAWMVDHCHATGRVRGVLCSPCNLGLGHFRDDVDVLAAAISYLGLGQVGAQDGS